MNIPKPLLLSMWISAAVLCGCGRREEPPPPPPSGAASKLVDSANQAGKQAVDAAREVGQQVTETARQAGQAVGEAVKQVSQDLNAAAQSASATVSARYQEAVARAQALFKETKYEEALNALKSLSGLSLSSEQKKVVADLQAQIQAAWDASKKAGATATDAVKGLFK